MNQRRNPRFIRPSRRLALKKLVLVATEGAITERQYIDIVRSLFLSERRQKTTENLNISVAIVKHRDQSSPRSLLQRLRREIEDNKLDENYSAWLICDRDQWTREQFQEIQKWVDKDPDRNHWILSAPNFEYWLSLHFDNKDDCRTFFERYDKKLQTSDFSYGQIVSANKKARQKFQNSGDLLEHDGSQMFQFVEFLAKEYGLERDFN
ncbi:MAG: RloB domain-containing protein [Thermoguttaceae bacterium]|nr:RloB domain-containing protein [Thermoguttaceae bacterium]